MERIFRGKAIGQHCGLNGGDLNSNLEYCHRRRHIDVPLQSRVQETFNGMAPSRLPSSPKVKDTTIVPESSRHCFMGQPGPSSN